MHPLVSKLGHSMSWAFVAQILLFVIPLVQLTFLSRTVGVDAFGHLVLASAIGQLCGLFADFGLSQLLPVLVAEHSGRSNISLLFAASTRLRLAITMPVVILALVISRLAYPAIPASTILLGALAGSLAVLVPTWAFLGLERLRDLALIGGVSQALVLAFVVLLVDGSGDINTVLLLQIGGTMCGIGLSMLLLARQGQGLSWGLIMSGDATALAVRATSYCVSRVAVSTYIYLPPLFLGAFAGSAELALFGAAERLYRASQAIFFPVLQAFLPMMVRTKDFTFFRDVTSKAIATSAIMAFVMVLWGSEICRLLFGEVFSPAGELLGVFGIALIVNTAAVFVGYPLFESIGKPQYANRSVTIGALLHLAGVSALLALDWISGWSMVILILFTEITVAAYRIAVASRISFPRVSE
ncbi:MAG: hypothetical protein EG825_02545 [Rhodocyclaceae bacterium]|nr:hypothetical protein [Rhodocyclaceae bacterium]